MSYTGYSARNYMKDYSGYAAAGRQVGEAVGTTVAQIPGMIEARKNALRNDELVNDFKRQVTDIHLKTPEVFEQAGVPYDYIISAANSLDTKKMTNMAVLGSIAKLIDPVSKTLRETATEQKVDTAVRSVAAGRTPAISTIPTSVEYENGVAKTVPSKYYGQPVTRIEPKPQSKQELAIRSINAGVKPEQLNASGAFMAEGAAADVRGVAAGRSALSNYTQQFEGAGGGYQEDYVRGARRLPGYGTIVTDEAIKNAASIYEPRPGLHEQAQIDKLNRDESGAGGGRKTHSLALANSMLEAQKTKEKNASEIRAKIAELQKNPEFIMAPDADEQLSQLRKKAEAADKSAKEYERAYREEAKKAGADLLNNPDLSDEAKSVISGIVSKATSPTGAGFAYQGMEERLARELSQWATGEGFEGIGYEKVLGALRNGETTVDEIVNQLLSLKSQQ